MHTPSTLKKPAGAPFFRLMTVTVSLTLAGVFFALAEDVWFHEGFAWDAPVMLALHHLQTPFLDWAMQGITQTGEIGAVVVAVSLALWFVWRRQRQLAYATLSSLAGGAVLNAILKLVFARPRPALFPPLVIENGFSFPSGHVAASMAVYGFLSVLLWRTGHRFGAVGGGVWVILIAISRVYLGVHYPSDVLGAMAFTALWLMLVFAVYDRATRT